MVYSSFRNVPEGQLREIITRDERNGQKIHQFIGQHSFVRDMTIPGRKARIWDDHSKSWFPPQSPRKTWSHDARFTIPRGERCLPITLRASGIAHVAWRASWLRRHHSARPGSISAATWSGRGCSLNCWQTYPWRFSMPIKEVWSPVSRPGSKVGSSQP